MYILIVLLIGWRNKDVNECFNYYKTLTDTTMNSIYTYTHMYKYISILNN